MAAPNTVARDMNVMAERKGHEDDVNIPGKRANDDTRMEWQLNRSHRSMIET